MRIDRLSFRNGQAWIAVYSELGEYLGTWHVVFPEFIRALQAEMPDRIRVWKE